MSEQGKYRKWTAQQKLEIVVAGLRGDRSAREVCREHGISETLYYGWRDKLFEGGKAMLAGKEDRSGGFRAYYLVRPSEGEAVTISVFDDQRGGEESTRRAAK